MKHGLYEFRNYSTRLQLRIEYSWPMVIMGAMRSSRTLVVLTCVTVAAGVVVYGWILLFYLRNSDAQTPAFVADAGIVGVLSALAATVQGFREMKRSSSRQILVLVAVNELLLLLPAFHTFLLAFGQLDLLRQLSP